MRGAVNLATGAYEGVRVHAGRRDEAGGLHSSFSTSCWGRCSRNRTLATRGDFRVWAAAFTYAR